MDKLGYLLSGGFAKGYRTYILAGVMVVSAVASYAVGDKTLEQTVTVVWEIALGLGLGTARAAAAQPAAPK